MFRTLIALAAVLALAGPSLALDPRPGVSPAPPPGAFKLPSQMGRDIDLKALFMARNARTLEVLAADFPADHAALLERLGTIEAGGGTEQQMLRLAFEELTELRRKYAERLVFAPPQALGTMLMSLADFYDLVLKTDGATVCGQFAQDGSGALYGLGLNERYGDRLDQQSAAYFDAVVQAIEVPEYNGVAGDGDWGVVLATMVTVGVPAKFVATIAKGSADDPDLCPALAAMFRTSAAMKTPEGARARADFAKNLTGY